MSNQQRHDERSIDEAAAWVVRLQAPDVTRNERREFQEWLVEDPSHRSTFEEVQSLSADVDLLSGISRRRPEVLDPEFANIVEQSRAVMSNARAETRFMRHRRLTALAASLVLALGGVLYWGMRHEVDSVASPSLPEHYRTVVGEKRTVVLADGSVITLNTNTVLSATLTPTFRRLRLQQGEAYFDVARDLRRPFSVNAGGGVVQVVGTVFNIKHRDQEVLVTVYEGEVKIRSGRLAESAPTRNATGRDDEGSVLVEHVLSAGEQIGYGGGALQVARLKGPMLDDAAAWRYGKLIFDGESLADIVAEVQPYVPDRIVIVDPEVAEMTAGGVFDTDSSDSILNALEIALPVHVERRPGVVLLKTKGPAPEEQ